jgi:hypothetical protein
MGRERAPASEPDARGGAGAPGSASVGEPEGRSPSDRIERRLLILWFALAFVVWNGVYDMRMHDTVRGYLLETAEARAGLGGGVDMRQYLRRGRIDAVAFSTAWSLGVFLAGIVTMRTYRVHLMHREQSPSRSALRRPSPTHPTHP